MSRRMCRTAAPAWGASAAGLLLSGDSGGASTASDSHGGESRPAQAEQLLHHDRYREGCGFLKSSASRKLAADAERIDLLFRCSRKKQIPRYARNDNAARMCDEFPDLLLR